jgi:amino acid transporter
LFATFYFPGANLILVFLLGAVPASVMCYVYGKMGAAMPRSGGDYVWSTRVLGPIYGTVQFVFMFAMFVFWNTFNLWQMFAIGLSPAVFGVGAASANPGITQIAISLGQASLGYPLGMISLLALLVIAILGLRVYAWFVRISVPLYLLITAIFVGGVIMIDTSTFPATFDAAMKFAGYTATYNGIIQGVAAQGFNAGQFSLTNTLLAAIPWGFLTYVGFNWSSYFAGESKNVKTSMYRAYVLSVALTAVVLVLMTLVVLMKFGTVFINSVTYADATNASIFPVLPLVNFFLALSNPALGLLVGIGLYLGWFINTTGMILFMSRIIFATAFDRVIPTKFADVSERFHSPHWAIVLIGAVTAVYTTLYWYYGYVATVLNTSILVPIGLGLPLFATFLFPLVKPSLYERCFGSMRGAKTMAVCSLIGVLAFGFYAFAETTPLISGTYLGASLYLAYEVVAVLIVIGILVYVVSKWNMKKMGIDPSRIFHELPPE